MTAPVSSALAEEDRKMKRTVGFIDILGFRKMTKSVPAEELGEKYNKATFYSLQRYENPITMPHNEPAFFPNVLSGHDYCLSYVLFSDCLVITAHDDSEDSALKVLLFAYRYARSMIAQRFPVRGGIAYGEMFVDLNNRIFVGSALTEAYDIERKQEWMGITIDQSLVARYPNLFSGRKNHGEFLKCLFVPYLVPMKSGNLTEEYTINWRWNLVVEKGIQSLFAQPTDWKVKIKIDNTLKYSLYIRNNRLAYPTSDGTCPIEIRKFYVGSGPPGEVIPRHGDEY